MYLRSSCYCYDRGNRDAKIIKYFYSGMNNKSAYGFKDQYFPLNPYVLQVKFSYMFPYKDKLLSPSF